MVKYRYMKLPKYKDLTPEQFKIYVSLQNAKQRCTNPKNPFYERYGGRGILYRLEEKKHRLQVVSEQEPAWQECKRKHPNEQITINRIDNNGHYEEDNIEWIPKGDNSRQSLKDNPHVQKASAKASAKALSKPVKCLTSGEVFPSAKEAERLLEINHSNISACCRGDRYKSAGKYKGKPRVWVFVEN